MTVFMPLAASGLQSGLGGARPRGETRLGAGRGGRLCGDGSVVSRARHPSSRHVRISTPPEYAAIEKVPPGILAEYPSATRRLPAVAAVSHGRRLFNEAPTGPLVTRLGSSCKIRPRRARQKLLLALRCHLIVIHPRSELAGIERWGVQVAPREPGGESGYRTSRAIPNGASVWRVVAPDAGALVTLPSGFASPKRRRMGSSVSRWFPLTASASMELRALNDGVVF